MRYASDAATEVVIGCLEGLEPGDTPLIVDEVSGALAAALRAAGARPHVWCRRATRGGGTALPWPAPAACTSAFIRLPKEKSALEMALHAASSLVPAHAPIIVFGANDEGIRSAARPLSAVAEGIETLATRRHARVIAARRLDVIPGLKETLASWRQTLQILLEGATRDWVTYPGLFARGRIDDGTALLLAHLPDVAALPAGARILDFACGTGIIAAAVHARAPRVGLDMVDADAVAIAAARENMPGAEAVVGGGLGAAPTRRYAMILSNPPIHAGVSESLDVLKALVGQAPERLRTGGVLQIVVQRRLNAGALLARAFRRTEVAADDGRFQVLRGYAQA